MRISFDSTLRPGDIYTRANVGEVFPEVITPLVWALIGPGIEAAFVRTLREDMGTGLPAGVVTGGGHFAVAPRAAGRMHLNLSLLRRGADMMPGASAADLDRQYFGDAVASGLPPHPSVRYPRGEILRAVGTTLRTLVTIDRRVRRQHEDVRSAEAATDAFLAGSPSATDVLDRFGTLLPLHSRLFSTHVTARALTSAAVSTAMKSLLRSGVDEVTAMSTISSLPGLESALPSRAIASMAAAVRALPAGDPLREAVIAGLRWDDLAARTEPAAVRLRDEVDAFRARFGHRGVNEFDPAARTWATNPDGVLSMLRPVVAAAGPLPEEAAADGRPGFSVAQARKAMQRAERTKDNVLRLTHVLRRLLDALAAQLSDRLDREALLALTPDEVRAVAAGGPVDGDLVDSRLAELRAAAAVLPAEWSVDEVELRSTAAAAADGPLRGLAGAAGTAVGRVRLMHDVDGPFEDGEVLVAVVTDTAWTPLFLAASAVVTDQGGPLSHATIVARELGIPAVVNTKSATLVLRDGDLVEVDGAAGTVTVTERATPPSPVTT